MEWIKAYLESLVQLTSEMAPYLLLGFLFAGILNVYMSKSGMHKYFGGTRLRHIVNASVLGVPLPLCSCGVIPTGVSLYKNGASKSSSISFLISTPQTGVDSILATWSLIGLPFAIIRPIVAFLSGIFGGLLTTLFDKKQFDPKSHEPLQVEPLLPGNKFQRVFKYGFVEFMTDISKWLAIGLLLAALIAVVIPDGFFARYVGNDFLGMLILLIAAIPMYVCATGSIPIVAVLLLKGISPGAALVFLMAGPATNIASLTVLSKVLGRRSMIAYVLAIVGSSLLFGFLIDQFLPREWFTSAIDHAAHGHHLIPPLIGYVSAAILVLLMLNALIRPFYKSQKLDKKNVKKSDMVNFKVEGMSCNHCKMNVEKSLMSIEGVVFVEANPQSGIVSLQGEFVEELVREKLNDIGYSYKGQI